MKNLNIGLMLLGAAMIAGCGKQSQPGGPGASKAGNEVRVTQSENTFKIDVPNTETDIKQGQSQTVRIAIKRGTQFDQDVKLEFSGAPKGVTIKPDNAVAKSDMKEIAVIVDAAADAPLGEFKVKVTGTPTKEGIPTTSEFQVEVKKPD